MLVRLMSWTVHILCWLVVLCNGVLSRGVTLPSQRLRIVYTESQTIESSTKVVEDRYSEMNVECYMMNHASA